MVASWIGRSLVALPGILASLAAGMVLAGLTRAVGLSLVTVAVLSGAVLVRVSVIGITVDRETPRIVLRTFWRTHRLAIDDLRLVDARGIGDGWPPGVRIVTVDGQEYSSMALCYLDERRAGRFIAQLESIAGSAARVALLPTSFRPSVS